MVITYFHKYKLFFVDLIRIIVVVHTFYPKEPFDQSLGILQLQHPSHLHLSK